MYCTYHFRLASYPTAATSGTSTWDIGTPDCKYLASNQKWIEIQNPKSNRIASSPLPDLSTSPAELCPAFSCIATNVFTARNPVFDLNHLFFGLFRGVSRLSALPLSSPPNSSYRRFALRCRTALSRCLVRLAALYAVYTCRLCCECRWMPKDHLD